MFFDVVQVTPAIIRDGVDIYQTRQTSSFDAINITAAVAAGCSVLYSEDMQAGQVIHGVKIVNPFTI